MLRLANWQTLSLVSLMFVLVGCDTPIGSTISSSEDEISDDSANSLSLKVQPSKQKKITHMYLGTGSVQGAYFPIGGVICRLLNRGTSVHRLRCTLESTGGSVYNLRQLREGNFDLVFAQSDWQSNAYHGKSTFEKDTPNPDLRAVFALESDPIALITRQDSGIDVFDDLQQRVVSFGYTRALQHRVLDDLLEVRGWSHKKFKQVRRMSDSKQVNQLCNGGVDAILLLSSSLTDHMKEVPEDCKIKLVPIDDSDVDAVIEKNPYYRKSIVPNIGTRGLLADNVSSFGVGATFVASKSTSPKAVYHVVKEVVENFNDFKSLHPSLKQLSKKELPYAGISIPLHPGAVRYYEEAKLLK